MMRQDDPLLIAAMRAASKVLRAKYPSLDAAGFLTWRVALSRPWGTA